VKPIMGGTFTVKVTVVLKNGAKMTAEKEFTVNTYSMVLNQMNSSAMQLRPLRLPLRVEMASL